MIIELENAVVSILQTRFEGSGIVIEPIMDDIESIKALGARGCIIVKYSGEVYAPQNERQINRVWNIMIMVGTKHFGRKMDWGAYQIIEAIRATLTGVRIQIDPRLPILRLLPTVIQPRQTDAGIHWHTLEFQAKDAFLIP